MAGPVKVQRRLLILQLLARRPLRHLWQRVGSPPRLLGPVFQSGKEVMLSRSAIFLQFTRCLQCLRQDVPPLGTASTEGIESAGHYELFDRRPGYQLEIDSLTEVI